MKTDVRIIRIGGFLNILFLLFHLGFYWMLNWKQTLSCLDSNNWAIFYALVIITDLLLMLFVVVSFVQTDKLIIETNGRRILFSISAFYVTRIALEFILWGYNGGSSIVIIVACVVPAILYALPLIRSKQINDHQ